MVIFCWWHLKLFSVLSKPLTSNAFRVLLESLWSNFKLCPNRRITFEKNHLKLQTKIAIVNGRAQSQTQVNLPSGVSEITSAPEESFFCPWRGTVDKGLKNPAQIRGERRKGSQWGPFADPSTEINWQPEPNADSERAYFSFSVSFVFSIGGTIGCIREGCFLQPLLLAWFRI